MDSLSCISRSFRRQTNDLSFVNPSALGSLRKDNYQQLRLWKDCRFNVPATGSTARRKIAVADKQVQAGNGNVTLLLHRRASDPYPTLWTEEFLSGNCQSTQTISKKHEEKEETEAVIEGVTAENGSGTLFPPVPSQLTDSLYSELSNEVNNSRSRPGWIRRLVKHRKKCKREREATQSSVWMSQESAAAYFTEEQLQGIHKCFRTFDFDHSGSLGYCELGYLLRGMGVEPSETELRSMLKELDQDGSGELEVEEFIVLMAQLSQQRNNDSGGDAEEQRSVISN